MTNLFFLFFWLLALLKDDVLSHGQTIMRSETILVIVVTIPVIVQYPWLLSVQPARHSYSAWLCFSGHNVHQHVHGQYYQLFVFCFFKESRTKPLCTLVVLRPLKSSGHKISQNWLRLARPSQSQTVSRKKQKKIVDHENGPKSPELSREHVDPKKTKKQKKHGTSIAMST